MSHFSFIFSSSHPHRVALVLACTALSAATIPGTAAAGQSLGIPTAVRASRANIWVPTGTMSVVRKGATATVLADGDVLVAGGGTPKAELYDPTTRSFSPAGTMSISRTNATATLLDDGAVLVAGGALGGHQTTSADLYSPSDGSWTPTAPLHTARSGQTANLLPDGDVLIAGGGCNGTSDCDAGDFLDTLKSTEIYDPSTATWTNGPDMAAGREFATATTLADGQVLVAGGFSTCDDDFCKDTPSAQVYDSTSGSWTRTAPLRNPRQQATATLMSDGRVLLAGGTTVNGDMGRAAKLREAEIYDPNSGRWSLAPAMPEAHSGATAALLSNGWTLVAGGGTALASVYQPTQNRWVRTGTMFTPRTDAAVATLSNGDVLVAGGGANTAETYRTGSGPLVSFSPSTLRFGTLGVGGSSTKTVRVTNEGDGPLHVFGVAVSGRNPGDLLVTDKCSAAVPPSGSCSIVATFTPHESGKRSAVIKVVDDAPGSPQLIGASGYAAGHAMWVPGASMATGREDFAMVSLPGLGALVTGGHDWALNDLSSTELYNPREHRWVAEGSMQLARSHITATRLPDGRVLVAGGSNNFRPLSSAELFDPKSGKWSAAAPMHVAGYGLTQTLLPNGDVLVAGLGEGNQAEVYDPKTDSWTDTQAMAGSNSFGTATLLPDAHVLAVGGGTTTAQLYDPATNVWNAAAPMHTPRSAPQAVLLPDGQVLVAGGSDSQGGPLDTAELYDPSTNTWTYTENKMNDARMQFAMTLMPDGKVLAAGGCVVDDCFTAPLKSSEVFDSESGFWVSNGDLLVARGDQKMTVLHNGDVVMAGGNSGCCQVDRSVESYTPAFVSVRPASGPAGSHARLIGNGFNAFEHLQVQWEFEPYATARAHSRGSVVTSITIPQVAPGEYAVTLYGAHSHVTVNCLFTVTAS